MADKSHKFLNDLFSHYSKGETEKFFHAFDPHVKWIIRGEHDLAGELTSLKAVRDTYTRYTGLLRDKPKHHLRYLIIEGSHAVAVLFDEVVDRNGKNHLINYTLVLELSKEGNKILKVDNFVDSLQMDNLFKATSKSRLSA
jgi:ketosteroid isomerase-like protein